MWNRSFIFSFETINVSFRFAAPFVVALGICALARVGLAVSVQLGAAWPTSLPALLDSMREHRHREYGPPAPRVLLMGSSRLVDISSDCIAADLGIPRDHVANISHLGNSFWRNLAVIRRSPEIVASADVVYMDVSPYQINDESICLDQQFTRYATMEERIAVRDVPARMAALADVFYPIFSERRTIPEWIDAISFWALPSRLKADRLIGRADDTKRLLWSLIGPESDLHAIARNVGTTGPITELNAVALEAFIAELPAGCAVVFVHVPTDAPLAPLMYREPDRNGAWRDLREHLMRVAERESERRIIVHWPETPADLGLTIDDYSADSLHFSLQGNARMCDVITDQIEQLGFGSRP